jgi:opacity protein-like surface antigen
MKSRYFAPTLGLIFASARAFAADMGPLPMSAETAQPVAAASSGWYLRGDLGSSFDTTPRLTFNPNSLSSNAMPPATDVSPVFGANATKASFTTGVGVGYRFNEYFRTDATFDYRTSDGLSGIKSGIICPYELMGETSQTELNAQGSPLLLGYAYDPKDTCNGNVAIKQHNDTFLANGYFDIFSYAGVTPYVGAGAGVNIQSTSGSLTFTESASGQPYNADLTPTGNYPLTWVNPQTGKVIYPQPNITFAQQNWNRLIKTTKYNFAWALMAGVSYQLTPSLTLDLGYRYLNLGTSNYGVNPQSGAALTQRSTAQEVRVGLRLMAD